MKFLPVVFIFFLAGCTTPAMIMKSWVGHSEYELYQHWGQPTSIIDKGSNGKIVLYEPSGNDTIKLRYINARTPVEYIGPRNNEYKKVKSFYITPMGHIYAWKIK